MSEEEEEEDADEAAEGDGDEVEAQPDADADEAAPEEAAPPPPPPAPPDPNKDLWAARDALPLAATKEAKEVRESWWNQYGATVVESLTLQELAGGLQGTIKCPVKQFDMDVAMSAAYCFARKLRPKGLKDQLMFPEFRPALCFIKVLLDVRQVLIAARAAPALEIPEPAPIPEVPPLPEGVEEEALDEEEAQARAALIAEAEKATVLMEAYVEKVARLSAPLPESLDRNCFKEAMARLKEINVVADPQALWMELGRGAPGADPPEEPSDVIDVGRLELINWASFQLVVGRDKDVAELPDDDLADSGDAAAAARAHALWLENAHAVRRTREGLYDPTQPPGALVECLQSSEVDLQLAEALVAQKRVDKNFRDPEFGWAPLHYAANIGNLEICSLVLRAKGEIEARCNNGNTALHLAARSGHLETVSFLLSKKTPINLKNGNGWTALAWAANLGLSEIVDALLQAQAQIGIPDEFGRTEAMWAARHGHTKVAKTLLDKGGFDLALRDNEGLTLADHAQNYVEIHRALYDAEAATEGLLTAVQRNDTEAVKQCIQDGANVNAQDDSGWSALTWSMMHRSVDLVRLLAQYNADPSVLVATSEVLADLDLGGEGLKEELEHTLNRGLESKERLLSAARNGQWEAVERELDEGALINSREDGTLLTCLMFAAIHCNAERTWMLAERKAQLDLRDDTGLTAAHFAVQAGDVETVALLHHANADLSLATLEGKTAQHLAARADDGAMVQVLAVAGVSVNHEDNLAETPLQVAATWGCASAASALLACGANELEVDRSNRTVLALGIIGGHVAVTTALLYAPALPAEVCDHDVLQRKDPRLAVLQLAADMHSAMEARYAKFKSGEIPPVEPTKVDAQGGKQKGAPRRVSMKRESGGHGSKPEGEHGPTPGGEHGPKSGGEQVSKSGAEHGAKSGGEHGSKPGGEHGSKPGKEHGSTRGPKSGAEHGAKHGGEGGSTKGSQAEGAPRRGSKAGAGHGSKAARGHSSTRGSKVGADGGSKGGPKPGEEGGSKHEEVHDDSKHGEEVDAKHPEDHAFKPGSQHDSKPGGEEGPRPGGERGRGGKEVALGCRPWPSSWCGGLLEVACEPDRRTPLALAVAGSHRGICPLLLDRKAEIDATDVAGNTPLMLAVAVGEVHMSEDLLAAGARRDVANEKGAKALDVAFKRELRELLQAHDLQERVAKAMEKRNGGEDAGVLLTFRSAHGKRLAYRCRLEGLPLMSLEEQVLAVLEEDLFERALQCRLRPYGITVATDPITARPLGYAYVDFLELEEARELERNRRDLRLGKRRIGVVNEGLRSVPDRGVADDVPQEN